MTVLTTKKTECPKVSPTVGPPLPHITKLNEFRILKYRGRRHEFAAAEEETWYSIQYKDQPKDFILIIVNSLNLLDQ